MHCFLHIGLEKTGTTRFQSILKQNREALSDQRIYIPTTPIKGNHRLLAAAFFNGEDKLIRKLKSHSKFERSNYFENFLVDFAAELKAAGSKHDICIITSEHLSSRLKTPSEINALSKFLKSIFEKITVVCYFREPISAIISRYHNHLKSGGVKSLDDFIKANLDDSSYNYNTLATNWADAFSQSNCIFRIYERTKLENEDIAIDLLGAISKSIDLKNINFKSHDDNTSFSNLEAAAVRAINKFSKNNLQKGFVSEDKIQVVKDSLLSLDVLKAGKLSTQFHREYAKKLAASNELFFQNFFDENTSFSKPPLNTGKPHQKSMREQEELTEALIYSVLSSTFGD